MPLRIFGISHKTAPIDVRERVAVDPERLPQALEGLVSEGGAEEALILSTCNRTELYCRLDDKENRHPLNWLLHFSGMKNAEIDSHLYTHDQEFAVRHALRVACGLDSMVLGEPQILGQLKQAYRSAVGQGTAGKLLNRLFQHSFYVAKQVRTETAIGENPVSVAFAAVKLSKQIHGDLSDKSALLVGAGETVSLVAHHLKRHGIGRIVVANRTLQNSQDLAARIDGRAVTLTQLPQELSGADIVVSSTASRLPIITAGAVKHALAERHEAPMFLVDLAVPRDIEAQAADLKDVYLYSVDDLNQVVGENSRLRAAAATDAEDMINLQAQSYMDWLAAQDSTKTISEIRGNAQSTKSILLEKAHRRLRAGAPAEAVIDELANGLTNKFLHQPTVRIREAALEGEDEIVRLARELLKPAD